MVDPEMGSSTDVLIRVAENGDVRIVLPPVLPRNRRIIRVGATWLGPLRA
jgi:hypothetical protein